jgi:hypothetical protein
MKFIRLSKQNLFKILLVFSLFFFFSGKEIEDAEIPDSPLSLTAGDGAGLVLKGYESNTVLDGFIAFTEIKLKFYNPENRRLSEIAVNQEFPRLRFLFLKKRKVS